MRLFHNQLFRLFVLVPLPGIGFSSCGPNSVPPAAQKVAEAPQPATVQVPGGEPGTLTPGEQRQQREEESKRDAVAAYPELGVDGTAVNREYVRRYKLYRAVNPAFFDEPDWPRRLADMLARDVGLDPRR